MQNERASLQSRRENSDAYSGYRPNSLERASKAAR